MATTPKKSTTAPVAAKAAAKKTAAASAVVTQDVAATAPAAKKMASKKAAPAPVAAAFDAPGAVPAAAKPAAKTNNATKTILKPSTAPAPVLSSEQRSHYVAVAAFYISERRGFTLGDPMEDWLAAEAEVDRLIASGHFPI